MPNVSNTVFRGVPRYPFFCKGRAYRTAKLIIGRGIITNKYTKLLSNTVILEDREKHLKLSLGAMGED
jgi:hypothetical protein